MGMCKDSSWLIWMFTWGLIPYLGMSFVGIGDCWHGIFTIEASISSFQ